MAERTWNPAMSKATDVEWPKTTEAFRALLAVCAEDMHGDRLAAEERAETIARRRGWSEAQVRRAKKALGIAIDVAGVASKAVA